ncbi:MAG: exosortase/archaeosortase family protein [Planctomycetota bacterium]
MGTDAQAGSAAQTSERDWRWAIRALLPFVLFAIIVGAPFYRVWHRWSDTEDYYTHGPLIPFVSMYLVLRKKKELTGEEPPETGELYAFGIGAVVLYFVFADLEWDKRWLFAILCTAALGYLVYHLRHLKPEPWKPGLSVLVPGLLLCVVAAVHEIVSVGWFFSMVLVCGLVLYYLGKRVSKVVWFPLFFLFTTVPMPEYIVQRVTMPLKKFATANTVRILRSPGVGIYCKNQGTKIVFPRRDGDLSALEPGEGRLTKEVTVGAVCSGLRSLIALISFGFLFAYITPLSRVKKLILLAATIPASFVANLFRILTLALVTYWWNADVATGGELWTRMERTFLSSFVPHLRKISNEPVHDFTGIMIFVVAFIGLFALERLLGYVEYRQKLAAEASDAGTGRGEDGDD